MQNKYTNNNFAPLHGVRKLKLAKMILCLTIIIVFVLSLSGCRDNPQPNDISDSSIESDQLPEDLTFQLGGFSSGSSYELTVLNPYYDDITISLVSVSANGWSVSGTGAGIIEKRGSGTIKLTLMKEDLQRARIDTVKNITARFRIMNSKNEFIKYAECHIGDDSINGSPISGTSITWGYNKDGIKVSDPLYLKDVVSDSNIVICLIENSTDEEIKAVVSKLLTNGTPRPYTGMTVIQKHSSGILVFKNSGEDFLNGTDDLTSLSTGISLMKHDSGAFIQEISGSIH